MFQLPSSKALLLPLAVLTLVSLLIIQADEATDPATSSPTAVAPLKALLIAGGCCHDYERQHKVLYEGIQKRANMRVDVVWTRDGSHDPPFDLYQDPDWAKGYDVIFHDECAALAKDETMLTNILNAHKTIPAVHLHCAMHSFRGSENDWQKHVGIKSTRHGPHVPVSVKIVNQEHPIMAGMEDWVTGKEELYNNVEVYDIDPLAMGTQTYQQGGKDQTDSAIVVWTNTKFDAPSFSTSLGHFNHNVEDPRYLDMITRGALWACGKLGQPEYEVAYTGENQVTELAPKPGSRLNPSAHPSPNSIVAIAAKESAKAKVPAGSRLVNLTAKSTQKERDARFAMDADSKTRWCGNGPDMPTWLQVELDKPTTLSGAEIEWEIPTQWMQYNLATSTDGNNWTVVFDASNNQQAGVRRDSFKATDAKYLRVNLLKQQNGMWPSLFELRLFGADGKKLPFFPKSLAAAH